MAIESIGYAGSITDAQVGIWSRLTGGATCTVLGATDFKVTPAAGDRTVAVAIGTAAGDGVVDTSDAVVNVVLPSVSSGSRWDLIGVHRDWSSSTSSVERIAGTSTKAIPDRPTDPGDESFQPLALVRVAAGSTAIQEIIDLRVWAGDGGATAMDDLVRSYFDRIGTMLTIGDLVWARRLSVLGAPEWVLVVGAQAPYVELRFIGGQAAWSETPLGFYEAYTEVADAYGWYAAVNKERIKPTLPGRYRVTLAMSWSTSGGYDKFLRVWKNGTSLGRGISTTETVGSSPQSGSFTVDLNGTTDYLHVNGYGSGVVTALDATVLIEYLGPR